MRTGEMVTCSGDGGTDRRCCTHSRFYLRSRYRDHMICVVRTGGKLLDMNYDDMMCLTSLRLMCVTISICC